MTDNEIIKALEVHSNEKFDNCEGCPYLEGDFCEGFTKHSKPFRDVLDLIKRQKAEIEKKDIEIDILIRKKETLRDEISELRAEVERLQKEGLVLNKTFMDFVNKHIFEAIKEFAERLKHELEITFDEPIFDTVIGKIIDSTIDKLLRELESENNV